jgi:hypothetical protein
MKETEDGTVTALDLRLSTDFPVNLRKQRRKPPHLTHFCRNATHFVRDPCVLSSLALSLRKLWFHVVSPNLEFRL